MAQRQIREVEGTIWRGRILESENLKIWESEESLKQHSLVWKGFPLRCVYQFRQFPKFINLISLLTFVILPITFNHIQSPGRQVWAFGSDPKLLAPVVPTHQRRPFLPYPAEDWLPLTFTRHSELFKSIKPYYLNSPIFLLVVAIELLVPWPYLIAGLLRHQRRLPYWCTLVWNSHQLIPNKAYSPRGRLLRKR